MTAATASHDAFTYTGTWTRTSAEHYSSDVATPARAKINLVVAAGGSTFTLRAMKNHSNHVETVQIDNGAPVNVNLNSWSSQQNVVVYTSPTLAAGNHTVTVTVTQASGSVTGAGLSNGSFGGPGYSPSTPSTVTFNHGTPTDTAIPVTWSLTVGTDGANGVRLARDGADGGWSGDFPASGSTSFSGLALGTTYHLTATPLNGTTTVGTPSTMTATTTGGTALWSPVRAATPQPPSATQFSVANYGGVGNGTTNNAAAFVAARQAAINAGGGTVYFPAGTWRMVDQDMGVSNGVSIVGAGRDVTIIKCERSAPANYANLFNISGNNVTIQDLTVIRNGDFNSFAVVLGSGDGLTLRRVTLECNHSLYPVRDSFGVYVPSSGTLTNLVLDNVTIHDAVYGLFQTDTSTAIVDRVLVTNGCRVQTIDAEGLCFNAPAGKNSNIIVEDCTLLDGGAFAISFANVQHALVQRCTVSNWALEFLHSEAGTSDVEYRGNILSGNISPAPNDWYSFIWISGNTNTFRITGNTMTTSPSNIQFQCVWAGPGGSNIPPPTGIVIYADNHVSLATNCVLEFHYGGAQVTVQ